MSIKEKLESLGKNSIELHFGGKAHHGLHLIYSDDDLELSMTAGHDVRSNHDENI